MLKESYRYEPAKDEFEEEKTENVKHKDVNKILQVDSSIMNFNTYYPGKLLGSTLMVTNLSDCE